ncbi:prolyl oligopeptidase family serine peptidase [Sphingobacterium sp. HJSM2_6]|uniref:carboxylesterase family protein n=1 Tax=Sphingobacterium sp. HJSM2_6 TaxID=3366264 RepID=UPI003BE875E5
MKIILLFIPLFFFLLSQTFAQLKAVKPDSGYSYFVRTPEGMNSAEKLPVIVFLHGRSLSGHDLNRVKRYGVLRAIERGKELNAIIIAPQTSNGWDPDKVIEVLDHVMQEYPADKNRVYICGMSMGGYGTMDVAGKYPERFAAAVAICGGGTEIYACNLTQVPLWIQHGSADRAVPASESKKIYNAIKRCDKDADATLTIIPGGTHGSVENLFHGEKIYEFMFKHHKEG